MVVPLLKPREDHSATGPAAWPPDFSRLQRSLESARDALTLAQLRCFNAALVAARPSEPLAKWGDSWRNQPRVPAGNPDGGEWTSEDGGLANAPAARPDGAEPRLPLSDGVYRPETDKPQVTLTGGGDEESRSANEPPPEVRTLESIFPGLRTSAAEILMAPIDAFLGFSEAADAAHLEATMAQYNSLVAEIKRLDPTFADEELLPEGGVAGLDWQARGNLIDSLRMKLAAEYYLKNGDLKPLQGETVAYLRKAVDAAYDIAVADVDAGRSQPRLSREEAVGNAMDARVRGNLKDIFSWNDVPFGAQRDIAVNNRDYDSSKDVVSYRMPDARIGDVVYDWTLSTKMPSDAQVRGFFSADSQPIAVVIIRPSQLGGYGVYLIKRPANHN